VPFVFSFFTGGSFHEDADKIRAKFGDIRCRKNEDGAEKEQEEAERTRRELQI
jgi:hypothetical protein